MKQEHNEVETMDYLHRNKYNTIVKADDKIINYHSSALWLLFYSLINFIAKKK